MEKTPKQLLLPEFTKSQSVTYFCGVDVATFTFCILGKSATGEILVKYVGTLKYPRPTVENSPIPDYIKKIQSHYDCICIR